MAIKLTAEQCKARAQAYLAAAKHLESDWTANSEERKLSDELLSVYYAESSKHLAMSATQPKQHKVEVGTPQSEAHENLLQELIGRMYETTDISIAIQAGQFKSLDDLASHLKTQQGRLDRTIKAAIAGGDASVLTPEFIAEHSGQGAS